MDVHNDRLESKTTGAVVIDIEEIRARREQQKNVLISLRDPVTESSMSFWILLLLIFACLWYFLRRG